MTEMQIYQNFVEKMISPNVTAENMMGWALLGLGAEAGEMMGLAEKALRRNEPLDEAKFMDEAGDVLFFWMACLSAAGIDPDDVIDHNIDKLNQRAVSGTVLKRG